MNPQEPEYYEIALTHKVAGSHAGPLKLSYWIMQLSADDPEQTAQISKVDLKGTPEADGTEIDLEPANKKFTGDQTWTLDKQTVVVDEDDNGMEIVIELRNIIIRQPAKGEPSARGAVSADGKDVLASENWVD